MKAALLYALLIITAAHQPATAFSWPWEKQIAAEQKPPRPVVSIIVTDAPPPDRAIPGAIAAKTEVSLAFQTLGRLTARPVDIGDVVTKGQILATLDPDDLQSNVRASSAAADTARVELRTAEATADRTRALAARNVATTAQLEDAERGLATAQAAVQQAESELLRAQDAEGFAEMKAPFGGVISAVDATPGEVVSAGQSIMRLSGQDAIEAVIDIPGAMASRLSLGDAFQVWSENDPSVQFVSRISQMDPVADAATRTRRVHLALENDDGLRLGALIRARPADNLGQRLTVPAQAVFLRDGASYLWVVHRTGPQATVASRPVVAADSGIAGFVGVTSGLTVGEEVVIRGAHTLTDGQAVGKSVAP